MSSLMQTVRVDIPTCHSTPFHSDTAVQEHHSSSPPPQPPQPLCISPTVLKRIAQPLSKMEIRHVCMALSTIMQFRMCFCCKIRTAIQVDHRYGGYDAKTIPRIHPCLRVPAVNPHMCKALRFPLCPLCALCVCSLLQVCLDSINTLLPDWTVALVFDTRSFLFL